MSALYAVPDNQFDPEKFKERYGLTDEDFTYDLIDCRMYVRLADGITLPDDPPVFEAPPPLKTSEDYALELIERLMPGGTDDQKSELGMILRKFKGELPADRKTAETPEQRRRWRTLPPIHLKAGTIADAPLELSPGPLLTRPKPGVFEYTDDGVNGHLYFTVNVNGFPQRIQLI